MTRAALAALLVLFPSVSVAQQPVGKYEVVECFAPVRAWAKDAGLECGWLTLPEIASRPDGPTVRLAVTRLRVANASAPPLVYLHGGPGGAGAIGPSTLGRNTALSAGVRDVIHYDQRAVGLSEPKLCTSVPASSPLGDTTGAQERWNASARACVADMKAKGRDRSGYTSVTAADDLRELRLALGYDTWDLYGVSYGGRLALEAMRRDPTGIRAVVVNSPAIPSIPSMTEDPISTQVALERLFARCTEQADCQRAFPTLAQDFQAVYDSLAANPLTVSVLRGTQQPMRYDGRQFLHSIRCQLNARKLRRIPLAIHELRRGNRQQTAALLANDCFGGADAAGAQVNVKNYLINCADGHGDRYWEARRAVAARVKPMWLAFVEGGEECDIWQARYADTMDLAPLRSDIPTLVITGEFDERTPTSHAQRGTVNLTRKYIYEMPGDGHGTPASPCAAQLIRLFLADPTRAPASCAVKTPIPFSTSSLTLANFSVEVEGTARVGRFVGAWEAELPAMPRPMSVQLSVAGDSVTGMWLPNRLPIAGRLAGDTLRFSVKSPDGTRTISFAGTPRGDGLAFVRTVDAPPGTGQGGGIFGTAGIRSFTMTRRPPEP